MNRGRSRAYFVVQFGQEPDFKGLATRPQDYPVVCRELNRQQFQQTKFQGIQVSNKANMSE